VKQTSVGKSTLGAKRWWFDDITGRLNDNERGKYLGEFDTGDVLLVLYKDGSYETSDIDTAKRFDNAELIHIGKLTPTTVVSAVHFDGNKEWTMVKRFKVETTKNNERFSYLTDHKKSSLLFASVKTNPRIQYTIKIGSKKMDGEASLAEFIDVKGWKALGNKLSDQKLMGVKDISKDEPAPTPPSVKERSEEVSSNPASDTTPVDLFNQIPNISEEANGKYHAGDTIDFD
jgi:topoisomerase IV subunit A